MLGLHIIQVVEDVWSPRPPRRVRVTREKSVAAALWWLQETLRSFPLSVCEAAEAEIDSGASITWLRTLRESLEALYYPQCENLPDRRALSELPNVLYLSLCRSSVATLD